MFNFSKINFIFLFIIPFLMCSLIYGTMPRISTTKIPFSNSKFLSSRLSTTAVPYSSTKIQAPLTLLNYNRPKSFGIYNAKCKNPTDEYLQFVLSEYTRLYMKHKQSQLSKYVDGFEYEELSEELYDTHLNENKFIDNTQCFKHVRNRTTINQRSLCPWKHIIKNRTEKYPFWYTNVQCTCDECSIKKEKKTHQCSPVMKLSLILEKTEEFDRDGLCKWKPATEFVNVACVCAEKGQLIPTL